MVRMELLARHRKRCSCSSLDRIERRRMRDEDEWKDYRRWYARLRKAWSDGHHDVAAEEDVHRVTEEIKKRLAQRHKNREIVSLDQKEIVLRPKLKANMEVSLPGLKLEIEADSLERLQLPEPLRNWYVDTFRMRDHRKLLMRMSLAQHSYDNLTFGLKNVWENRPR